MKMKGVSIMINSSSFGCLPDGRCVTLYTMKAGDFTVRVMNYGATLVSYCMGDTDVLLGYDDVTGYIKNDGYFGAVIGRFGNRIKKGRFTLNGREYKLFCNDGENHLHGGKEGFDSKLWTPVVKGGDTMRFEYFSADMEEGYPGNMTLSVEYTLSSDGTLKIVYDAETDKPTVLNITNHSYFNLNGCNSGTDIMGHTIMINASKFSLADSNCLVTGELAPTGGTAFDFRSPKKIGSVRDSGFEQSAYALGGVDHNFVIDGKNGDFRHFVTAEGDISGIKMDCFSDQPAIQFYTGNFINEGRIGKNGSRYGKHSGFCLETQNYPDAPNDPAAPSPVLDPGGKYHHETTYRLYR